MSCGSTTCTLSKSDSSASRPFSGLDWSVPNPYSMLAKIGFMHERWRQRRLLLELDDRLLADIGLSRREALKEARKPFWK
jgi:uncharacterized protein YjiS (DUF1127 family)